MKYIFFGTPTEATIVLDTLAASGFLPSLIVTAPDRPAGRGLNIEESPVAAWGRERAIEVYKPESLRNEESLMKIQSVISNQGTGGDMEDEPSLAIVFAYGKIIPESILSLFSHGILNIHPSLLPLHRGPAPIEGALLAGDTETGVSIMLLDKEMDHGPILAQEKITISETETAPELLVRLIKLGSERLTAILPDYISGKSGATPQDHEKATYTKKITKADGEINLADDPVEIYKKYRAYSGWPGIYYFLENRTRIAIKKARFEHGAFVIERIVPEGKKEMDYVDYKKNALD